MAAKARFSEPNRSMTAGVPGNSIGSGSRPSAAMASISGSRACAGFLQPQLGDAPPGEDLPAAEAVGEELLVPGLVLEQVERADPGRDGLGLQLRFEVGLQLALLEEFLERAPAGQHAVAELHRLLAPPGHQHLRRDGQHLPAQAPGASRSVAARSSGSSMTLMT